MKTKNFSIRRKHFAQTILILVLLTFVLGTGKTDTAYAGTASGPEACGKLLAAAEARFLSTLAPDGSVPVTPETRAAAQEYIRVSKQCYASIQAENAAGTLQAGAPTFIDEGGILVGSDSSAEFVATGNKWGTGTIGTTGGTVSYSFMGNGISFSAEKYGNSVAITSLPNFQTCFITEIQNAFAAWQAVSNIRFVQVNDNGAGFNADGATGDIRIGAHAFDGSAGTLAHAYYPPPNWVSAAGDMHFDSAEPWTCDSSGVDIGMVALHEIGHALGLAHEDTSKVAVMDPTYNESLISLQSDDINGAVSIYGGPATLAGPPPNDNIGTPTTIPGIPFSETLDTTGAASAGDGPQGQILCEGKLINKGTKNVWYTYTTSTTRNVSFDTLGSTPPAGVMNYDTYIAVWTNGLSLVGCNDDAGDLFQSQLVLRLTPGTYLIEIAQYNGDTPQNPVTPTGGTLQFHVSNTSGGDTVGVFRPTNGIIYLKNQNTTGYADISINYGMGGDYPIAGDWDGNDTDTIGVYRSGVFYLRNSNTIGIADSYFAFGAPGDQPVAADWDGDGIDTVGVYRSSNITFYLRNSNSSGPPDYVFQLGIPGDVGIAGDWDGNGKDTTGVFRPSNGVIYLKNANSTGYAETALNYGMGGDKPVIGDWNNDGIDTIGVYRLNVFYLRDSNTPGNANIWFALGITGDMPIAGNWNALP